MFGRGSLCHHAIPRIFFSTRSCTYLKESHKYLTTQEIDLYFPTLQRLNLCGCDVVVTRFPRNSGVLSLDLGRLERLDKYISPTAALTGTGTRAEAEEGTGTGARVESHPNKVLSFHGGRIALRRALRGITPATHIPEIARSPRGAPTLPPEVMGSISHKDNIAVACAMLRPCLSRNLPRGTSGHLGVDIEYRSLNKPLSFVHRFAERVLTGIYARVV
jgi:hypothetical protein